MGRLSRNLTYVLFVLVVVFFLSLRVQRGESVVLGRWPFHTLDSRLNGTVLLKQRADGSRVLVLKLDRALREGTVLLQTEDGLWRELGRLHRRATFVSTIPDGWPLAEPVLRLVGPGEMVLAEVPLRTKE